MKKTVVLIVLVMFALVWGCKKNTMAPEPGPTPTNTPVTVEDVGESKITDIVITGLTMKIDSNGTVYLAYYDRTNVNNLKIVVKRLSAGGTTWEDLSNGLEVLASSDGTDAFSFELNENGIPFMVIRDAQYSGKATTMKYEGGAWVVLGQRGFSQFEVNKLALSVKGSQVFIAYGNSSDNTSTLKTVKYDSDSNSFTVLCDNDFSNGRVWSVLTCMKDDYPIISSTSYNTTRADVFTYNIASDTWENIGPIDAGSGQSYAKHLFYQNGYLYIYYSDSAELKYILKRYDFSSQTWDRLFDKAIESNVDYKSMIYFKNTFYTGEIWDNFYYSPNIPRIMKYDFSKDEWIAVLDGNDIYWSWEFAMAEYGDYLYYAYERAIYNGCPDNGLYVKKIRQ